MDIAFLATSRFVCNKKIQEKLTIGERQVIKTKKAYNIKVIEIQEMWLQIEEAKDEDDALEQARKMLDNGEMDFGSAKTLSIGFGEINEA